MTTTDWLEGVEFEDEYFDPGYYATTLYFTAPISLREKLGLRCTPEMENTDISLEYTGAIPEARGSWTCIGYTINGCTEDWDAIIMPYEVIDGLLDIYRNNINQI